MNNVAKKYQYKNVEQTNLKIVTGDETPQSKKDFKSFFNSATEFLSSLFSYNSDLNFEEWQRLESKKTIYHERSPDQRWM